MTGVKVCHVSTIDMALRYLLLNQLRAMRAAGYDVYGISAPGPNMATVEAAGIHTVGVPMSRRMSTPLTDLTALWRLYRIMRRERFTIVHTHTPKAALLAQYAALMARVPVRIHTIHGLYFPDGATGLRRTLFVLLERATMLFSRLNLSQNPEDIPVAVQRRICNPNKVRLLGNGIDLTAFNPSDHSPEDRAATRHRLGLEPNDLVVGIVARFVAEKGYPELLQAARVIRQERRDVRFIFIGDVEESKSDALRPSVISDMDLEGVVRFLGHRDDVASLYAIMDVFTLPSHREGFPRSVMEAATMGLPAVVTDIRGCRQTVDDGVTGRFVPPRDPSALANAVLELLRDPEKRREYGQAARRKALAEFDERRVFGRVLEAYRELLTERGLVAPAPGDT